jgi:hypothetical protein
MSSYVPRNFEPREDTRLAELVQKYGTDSWNTIATELGNRTARQCRNRYTLFLAPGVNNEPWTPEDDNLLKQRYEELGPKWALLRQFFPGRTDLSIKNRFIFLARNSPEIRAIRARYEAGHGQAPAGGAPAQKKAEKEATLAITFDELFQSLPYYMKRCTLLETILETHQLPVPPHGICDSWGVAMDDRESEPDK